MDALRRLDDGLARGEAALAAVLLLAMVVVAALQALLRNAANLGLETANALLEHLADADPFLQKGTLWLAFLGASLATHADKHIAIDVLPRLLGPRARSALRAIVSVASAVVAFYLARVFWMAVLNNAVERPLEYEVMGASGVRHVCDAPLSDLRDAGMSRPPLFCALRALLAWVGVAVETPGAAAQLIAPAGFLGMSGRFALGALRSAGEAWRGGGGAKAGSRPEAAEDGADPDRTTRRLGETP